MSLDLPPAILSFLSFDDISISPLLIPVVSVIGGCAIAITAMYLHHRKRELWHQTARLAIEKGQPLPPVPDDTTCDSPMRKSPEHDFRAGLVLIAVGAGIYIFLDRFLGGGLAYVGAIPGLIGVALVLHGLLTVIFRKRADDRPPLS